MGIYEDNLREKANRFALVFTNLLLQAIQLNGMARIGRDDFPLANQHYENVQDTLREFSGFLAELYRLAQQNKSSGRLTPLYIDKSSRTVCYYQRQLALLRGMPLPECDPASPRKSNV